MGQIEIEQRAGQIGLKITQPNLNLKTTQPDLQIKTTPADLALHIEQPEIIIDLRASFNSMGLQDTYTFADSAAQAAKEACLQGIERRVSIGNQFTEPHGPSAGQIVAEASKPPEKKLVIGLMPSVPPEISAKMGTVKGTYTPAHINGKFNEGKVTSNFTWGRVDIYMEREPYINIKA
ncbi:DUF6470 family protein [Pelosinus sp. IPA-1]|uniref:DUF6470 family protein n=1 Tax=Pelosinus sp. IPA-1 TaxID=3029569 RepID=UPI0024361F02|nr:DUF6470 family protein [Pelosinus sp. IPA-1]GMB01690.1 hypothetical protein PIPA1_44900 [Pelosinus sp. IPA-1]